MKKWKKRIIIIVCVLGISIPTVVQAETSKRRENIKSKGTINYENGKVYLTSSDLTYLADEIDVLENTYKINTVNTLNEIGTYFGNDGLVVHDVTQNEVDTEEEKSGMSYEKIMEGVRQSQSVAGLVTQQVTDENGNLMFYKNTEAQNDGNILELTIQDTGLPVFYKAADAQNLSLGTAAWVDGRLLVGTGTDNRVCEEKGRRDVLVKRVSVGSATVRANGSKKVIDISSAIPNWQELNLSVENFAIESAWFASGNVYTDAGNSEGVAVIKEYSDGAVTVGTSAVAGHRSENCYTKISIVCFYTE